MKNVILKEVMRRLNEEAGAPLKHPVRRVVINPACGACGACGKAEIVRTTNAARIIVSQDRLDAILADIRAELDDQFRNLNLD